MNDLSQKAAATVIRVCLEASRRLREDNAPNNFGWGSSQSGNPTAVKSKINKQRSTSRRYSNVGTSGAEGRAKLGTVSKVIINPTMKDTQTDANQDDFLIHTGKARKSEKQVAEAKTGVSGRITVAGRKAVKELKRKNQDKALEQGNLRQDKEYVSAFVKPRGFGSNEETDDAFITWFEKNYRH